MKGKVWCWSAILLVSSHHFMYCVRVMFLFCSVECLWHSTKSQTNVNNVTIIDFIHICFHCICHISTFIHCKHVKTLQNPTKSFIRLNLTFHIYKNHFYNILKPLTANRNIFTRIIVNFALTSQDEVFLFIYIEMQLLFHWNV